MQQVLAMLQKLVDFVYALFFTRDDDLDVLQLLFATIVVVTLMVVWNVSMADGNDASVKIEGLVTLRWMTGLLVVTAVPKWLIPFVTKQTKILAPELKPKEEEPPMPSGF
jgi:hypothetical protein